MWATGSCKYYTWRFPSLGKSTAKWCIGTQLAMFDGPKVMKTSKTLAFVAEFVNGQVPLGF